MITDIWVSGQRLDMYRDEKIRFNFQANDVAEVKDRQASYTDVFSVPRTANNTQIFRGLGLPSDTSRIPYQKPSCQVKIEGFDLIVKGWINITDTGSDYKIHIYSGIINFFKAVENKNIGDLDLSEINHNKDMAAVVNSYTNPNYRYIIADYNGLAKYGDNIINIDYLIPSALVAYLWKKVHDYVGYSYSGKIFSLPDFKELFLSYSKFVDTFANSAVSFNGTASSLLISRSNGSNLNAPAGYYYLRYNTMTLNAGQMIEYGSGIIQAVQRIDGWYIFPAAGRYRVEISGTVSTQNGFYLDVKVAFGSRDKLPEAAYGSGERLADGVTDVSFNFTRTVDFAAGDNFTVAAMTQKSWNANSGVSWELGANIQVVVTKVENEVIDFNSGLKSLSITNFVKEIVNRFALTIFPDENSNHLEYLMIEERLDFATAIDWSEKYIARTNESYLFESYAQNNSMEFKYDEDEDAYNDGAIRIENKNIAEKKTAFKSLTYSPLQQETDFVVGGQRVSTPVFKMYDREANDRDGNVTIEYKGLNNRFYFLRGKTMPGQTRLGSKILNIVQDVADVTVADYTDCRWPQLIDKFYSLFQLILNDSRLHAISLNLGLIDLLNLSLKRLYYFRQEQQYYFLNKISWDDNGAKADFYRVKRTSDTNQPANGNADGTGPGDGNSNDGPIVISFYMSGLRLGTTLFIPIYCEEDGVQFQIFNEYSFEWEDVLSENYIPKYYKVSNNLTGGDHLVRAVKGNRVSNELNYTKQTPADPGSEITPEITP